MKLNLKNALIPYKVAITILLLVVFGLLYIILFSESNKPILTPTENTRAEFNDTTFLMQTRSADAVIMQFEVTAKLTDDRDLFNVKNMIYEASIMNNVLYFYNATVDGTINDKVWLPNATINSMAFEQMFMDLVAKRDSLNGFPLVGSQLPVNIIK